MGRAKYAKGISISQGFKKKASILDLITVRERKRLGRRGLIMSISHTTEARIFIPQRDKDSSLYLSRISGFLENSSTHKLNSYYYSRVRENQKQLDNIQKLRSFMELKNNWNDNGASTLNKEMISFCINLIKSLYRQPDVFSTGRQSIQFEYEKENGEYLEFEIFHDHIDIFGMDEYDNEREETVFIHEKNRINEVIRDFYERNDWKRRKTV
jgi:hypothetical protein